ncbi:MAG: hypothetical protein JXR38_01895, partial [Bacilli bacterium]|nr:hypothetical protein [Bacilli bacterium]
MKKVFIMMMTALMFLALAACNKGISTNTETSATIGVTTAEIPSVYYEEMEYYYVGEYLGCEVYELTDYVTEPIPMRTPLYEGEDILYYVSGESVLTRYIFIVDNEPLTINEVLDENILTIEQLYGLEFLGIKA